MKEVSRLRTPTIAGYAQILTAFAMLIAIGGILLSSPWASAGVALSPIDALFTAVSGVCVTGLSTIDVGARLSFSGQAVLLVLIQLGGLGITTVSTILLAAAGRATLGHAMRAGDTLAAVRVRPRRLLAWVAAITLSAEVIGAVILAVRMDGENRLWTAIFHSVSAFCNAGFSLQSDSLARHRSDAVVLSTIGFLIMLGGIGFIVHRQVVLWIVDRVRGKRMRLYLHSRAVLSANVCAWILGAGVFWGFERHNLWATSSGLQTFGGALFQSVSARTAGFQTIDFAAMREPTLFLVMFFMLIGASPGGCGGGLKVTTAAVLIATMVARLRGRECVSLFDRTVPAATVRRSFLLLTLTLLFLTVVVGALLISEESITLGGGYHQLTALAFEAVSAFGTVGFSAGVTPTLTTWGKVIIIACMFVGRVGPLLVALAIVRPRTGPTYSYPEEELAIG